VVAQTVIYLGARKRRIEVPGQSKGKKCQDFISTKKLSVVIHIYNPSYP
jgi:hypothetical protein